ncbi:MAG: hypothetical protein HPY53_06990 [Brevinematales bacterium]|nr:hypothetical protein [Brevinematales bacterium]
MKKLLFLSLSIFLLGACQLFHFFAPAAQNSLLQLGATYNIEQVGQSFSNIYGGGSIQFSINVDANGVPSIVFQRPDNTIELYHFLNTSPIWELVSTNKVPNMLYYPVLKFNGVIPYVAAYISGSPAVYYKFSSIQAQTAGTMVFGYPDNLDFAVTPSGKLYGAYYITGGYPYNACIADTNAGAVNIPFSNALSMISLQSASDDSMFLMVNSPGGSRFIKLSGTNILAAYTGENNMFDSSFAIDGANNIYTIYNNPSGTMKFYFDVRPVTNPQITLFLSRVFLENGFVPNHNQSCAATKSSPYYFYTFAAAVVSGVTNVSVMRLAPDGSIATVRTQLASSSAIENYKMACAPDGTLYVAVAQSFGPTNTITVWKLQ